jgi:hypothetical protein
MAARERARNAWRERFAHFANPPPARALPVPRFANWSDTYVYIYAHSTRGDVVASAQASQTDLPTLGTPGRAWAPPHGVP